MFKTVSTILVAAAVALLGVVAASAQDAKRGIFNVAGDVYRFQDNFHFGLVVVTDEGVVLVDTINGAAAQWLKDNLATITDKPVTHLIYSHSHLDHASGGQVFADGIEVIAQANAPDAIDGVTPTKRFDDSHVLAISAARSIELTWLGVVPWQGLDRSGRTAGKCCIHHRRGFSQTTALPRYAGIRH